MGTDIHIAVQRKVEGTWKRIEPLVPNRWREEGDPETTRKSVYTGRNYLLFAILADVRNGYGFAGCVTHEPVAPIAPDRDLPEDFESEMVDDSHEGTWMGDHSHTWVLLSELLGFDWENTSVTRSGWVNGPARASQLSNHLRAPQSYCGMVSGPGIRHVSLAALDAEIRSGKIDPRAYAEVVWESRLQYDLEAFLSMLDGLACAGPADEIRLVMGFDS